MKKTQHYALNQYDPEDNFLRTNFNADNAKLDTALKTLDDKANSKADGATTQAALAQLSQRVDGKAEQSAVDAGFAARDQILAQKCEAYFGSYTGNGVEKRVISIGFTPKAVIVKKPDNDLNFGSTEELKRLIAIAVQGVTGNILNVVENGFQVANHGHVNGNNQTYVYFAFK